MKVLRTALLSTLLTICFAHIGHAQRSTNNLDCQDVHSILSMGNGSLTPIEYGTIRVVYDATVLKNCENINGETRITLKNGTVLYSAEIDVSSTLPVDVTISIPPNAITSDHKAEIECIVCEGSSCLREGGTVQFTGG